MADSSKKKAPPKKRINPFGGTSKIDAALEKSAPNYGKGKNKKNGQK